MPTILDAELSSRACDLIAEIREELVEVSKRYEFGTQT
jgi:hypothetical protein